MPGEEPVASTSGDAATEEPAMTLEQFKEQLTELNKGLRSLPATAQVNSLAAAACCIFADRAACCKRAAAAFANESLYADRTVLGKWPGAFASSRPVLIPLMQMLRARFVTAATMSVS